MIIYFKPGWRQRVARLGRITAYAANLLLVMVLILWAIARSQG